MKVYLDDERSTPDGWRGVDSAKVLIHWLKNYPDEIDEISLDHDLGVDDECGYDVLLWIEEQVYTNNYTPPKISIHTANSSARVKMELALNKIKEVLNDRK